MTLTAINKAKRLKDIKRAHKKWQAKQYAEVDEAPIARMDIYSYNEDIDTELSMFFKLAEGE